MQSLSFVGTKRGYHLGLGLSGCLLDGASGSFAEAVAGDESGVWERYDAAKTPIETPALPAAFGGRDRELLRLGALFTAGARLVVVTGTAGVGKTWLASEFVRPLEGVVGPCDLSGAGHAGDFLATVALALGVNVASTDPIDATIDTIGRALSEPASGTDVLVVLDGVDRFVDDASRILARWIDLAPRARFVVTSREPLDVLSGSVLDIAPLENGDGAATNAAIEACLAALEPVEKRALFTCTVFQGSFTLEAAEAVLDVPADLSVSDVLRRLRGKSLLFQPPREDASDEPRFALYPSVREHLAPFSLDAETTRRHTSYYLRRAAAVRAAAWLDEGATRRLEAEHDDLFAVATRALDEEPTGLGVPCALEALVALSSLHAHRGPGAWLDRLGLAVARAFGEPAVDPRLVADALLARAAWRCDGDRITTRGELGLARSDAERALAYARRAADDVLVARSLMILGRLEGRENPVQAERSLRSALVLARKSGDVRLRALVLGAHAHELLALGNTQAAQSQTEEALRLLGGIGDVAMQAEMELRLGNVLADQAKRHDARPHFEAALTFASERGLQRLELDAAIQLAITAHDERDLDVAEAAYVKLLDAARRLGSASMVGRLSCRLGLLRQALRRLDEAEAAYEDASAMFRATGMTRWEAFVSACMASVHAERGDVVAAGTVFEDAEAALRSTGDGALGHSARVLRGHHDSSVARDALDRGDDVEAGRLQNAARARITDARRRQPTGAGPAACSSLVRAALETLKPALEAAPAFETAVVIAADGSWIRMPGCDRVSFESAPVRRRLLAALLRQRFAAPNRAVSAERLAQAAWATELRALDDAAKNRLYVVINALRRRGLESMLLRRQEGWFLDPAVHIVLAATRNVEDAAA